MEHYGILSLIAPLTAIFLAIKTRQVFPSLMLGIFFGWMVLSDWNLLATIENFIEGFVSVLKDSGNARTIMFSSLVGAIIIFIQRSGGVDGFINLVVGILEKFEKKKKGQSKRIAQLAAWFTGVCIFVESSINALTVGTTYRPIFDKLKIPREKLAYIADSISAPTCILIPLNAWGAYIMGLLLAQGIKDPFPVMLGAFLYNFYPMFAMLILLSVIIFQKDIGPMKKAERRAALEGKVLRDGAAPLVTDEITGITVKENVKPRAINMLLPIISFAGMVPIVLIYTGAKNIANIEELSFGQFILTAVGKGSGSAAVLYSVLFAIFVSAVSYRLQNIFSLKETFDLILKGVAGLIPMALLMLMAFSIGNVCKALGAGYFVAEVVKSWLTPSLAPFLIFIASCAIAFSTGTSWGTFAIMIPIAIPMAEALGANLHLCVSAVLSGGVFGDHCSPISDTTIISSMASACDLIDHVTTQLPYALLAGSFAAILFLIFGFAI